MWNMDSWPPKTSHLAQNRRNVNAAHAAKAITGKRYGRSHPSSRTGSSHPDATTYHTARTSSKPLWDSPDDIGHDEPTDHGPGRTTNTRTHQQQQHQQMTGPAMGVTRQAVDAHHEVQPRMVNYGSVALGPTDPAGPLYGASNVDIHMASSKETVDSVDHTAASVSNATTAASTSKATKRKGRGRRASENSPPPSPPSNLPATIAKWTLIASAAALWGYLCHLYYSCGEKTCCKEMQKFVTALQKAPDIPRMVLTFTMFAGTLLMLMTIFETIFGLYSSSGGTTKREAGWKSEKRSPRTSEAADEEPVSMSSGPVRRAQKAGPSSQRD